MKDQDKSKEELVIEIEGLRNELNAFKFPDKIENEKTITEKSRCKDRLKYLIDVATDGIWDWDLINDQVYYSKQWKAMLGYAGAELADELDEWSKYVHPDDLKMVWTTIDKHKSGETDFYSCEYRVICKDKSIKWILDEGKVVEWDEHSIPSRGIGFFKDITERKKNKELLRKSEVALNYAQEIAKMGSWNLNLLSGKQTWSENMYRIIGLQPYEKEITYDEFIKMIHPDDICLFDDNFQELILTQKSVSFDFRYILQDGSIKWMQNNIIPYFVKGSIAELKGVNIDITDKKLIEQELIKAKEKAEKSNQLKTAFLNNISHEIRTPLNGILGFAPFVLDPNHSERNKRKYLEILNRSSDRLIQTVTDYMDISLLTSANMDVNIELFSPIELLSNLFNAFQPLCELKGIELFTDFPLGFEKIQINSDRLLLEKVLKHLLSNALKFTQQGEITLSLEKKVTSLLFIVRDTGIGIGKDAQALIFENFMQEDESNTRSYEGSGLGLSIVREIIQLLGGSVWVDSKIGENSTFYLDLPYESIAKNTNHYTVICGN